MEAKTRNDYLQLYSFLTTVVPKMTAIVRTLQMKIHCRDFQFKRLSEMTIYRKSVITIQICSDLTRFVGVYKQGVLLDWE